MSARSIALREGELGLDRKTDTIRADLYLFGVPGVVGGAATKIDHLIRLLHKDFKVCLVLPHIGFRNDKQLKKLLNRSQVPAVLLKDLPKRLDGIGLAICVPDFFTSGLAQEARNRGLKVIWSNEMMYPFEGEVDAARDGIIDRVLYASEFQAAAFRDIHSSTRSFITGNYIDATEFPETTRSNPIFAIGRLSRADPSKYPLDFPVFYEELDLEEVRYRIMAWTRELQREYRWHRFGPKWDLLPPEKESSFEFLTSLDLFVYPLGHRFKESWGRAVVEAMLTGCVPVVPAGHQFHKLMVHGESGFICTEFREYQECVQELYRNYALRLRIAEQSARHARDHLCNPDYHRGMWIEALTA